MEFYSKIVKTLSEKDTSELGRRLSKELKLGDTISLEGDLGTGKTAITKGIAAGLGITDHVTSPTFTLVNTYEGLVTLHHFDVYRAEDAEELLAIGWEEYLDGEAVTIVEWGDLIPELLPANTIYIKLERDDTIPDGRTITIKRRSSR